MDWKLFTKVGTLALVAVVAICTGNTGTVAVLAPVAVQIARKF